MFGLSYVVDVQLGIGVGLTSPAERPLNVVLTEVLVEDGLTVRTIFFESFVDNVPLEELAAEVAGNGLDVTLGHELELLRGEVASLDPGGELRVPDKSVATDLLVVLLGPLDQLIGGSEVEDTRLRLNSLPLHGVLSSDLRELGRLGNLPVGGILIQDPLVYLETLSANMLEITCKAC